MPTAAAQPDHQSTRPPAASGDDELVARCLAGEDDALAALVERYQRDVYAACLRVVRDPDSAIEVANAAFFKAYANLATYDPARPLRPWLLRIATNEALNVVRGRQREREHTISGPEASDLAERAPGREDPEGDLLARERRAAVRAAVAALPERYRLLIVLRFFNDLSYAEIAAQTGQPINTVGVRLLRARTLLRRALAGEEIVDVDPS
jgi:RNA polymerase sigma factor (sigma-70 family)